MLLMNVIVGAVGARHAPGTRAESHEVSVQAVSGFRKESGGCYASGTRQATRDGVRLEQVWVGETV